METLPVRLYAAFAADETGGSMAAAVFEDIPLWPAARQRIAADLNAPATAFVRKVSGDRFQAKLHSAHSEIESSGPATLAVFAALKDAERIASGTFVLETTAGEVVADVAPDGAVSLRLSPPAFETDVPGSADLAELFALKVSAVTRVSCTSGRHRQLLIEVAGSDALHAPWPDPGTLERFCAERAFGRIALWSPDYVGLGKMRVQLRAFCRLNGAGGIEQAASVDVAGALACDLVRSRKLYPSGGGQAVLVVEQGASIGRPSLLRAVVTASGNDITAISAGGFAALRMSGEAVI